MLRSVSMLNKYIVDMLKITLLAKLCGLCFYLYFHLGHKTKMNCYNYVITRKKIQEKLLLFIYRLIAINCSVDLASFTFHV